MDIKNRRNWRRRIFRCRKNIRWRIYSSRVYNGNRINKYIYSNQYLNERGYNCITEFDGTKYFVVNNVIEGIDKTKDRGYVISGKRIVGVTSSFANNYIENTRLAIEYDSEGNELEINQSASHWLMGSWQREKRLRMETIYFMDMDSQ